MNLQETRKAIPFSRPSLGEEELEAVREVLQSGWITSGPKVQEFEERFATFTASRHALAVHSGTAALLMCLQALDLPPGSKVAMPALTWPSAVSAALFLHLRPLLVDVEQDTLNLSSAHLASIMDASTRVVVPVHFAGLPYDIEAVTAVVRKRNAQIIDDSAHALGASYQGAPLGRHALASCYSFHPIKNMTTGEGGMIVTGNERFWNVLKGLRLLGLTRDAKERYDGLGNNRYDVTALSLKHNMTDIQAAIGIIQLEKLRAFNEKRSAIAQRYLEDLRGVPGLILPFPGDNLRTHAWHLFVVRTLEEEGPYSRDAVVHALAQEGIRTGLHFISIPDLTYFQKTLSLDPQDTPHAVRAGRTVFSLPLYPDLQEEECRTVVRALRRLFQD